MPRVRCKDHGVVVCSVPWARHGAGHTRAFDDTAAWLARRTSKTAVTALLRIAWRTVGSIVSRVSADALAGKDRFGNLRRIGIDEISYKRGHRYLTVVVDHDAPRPEPWSPTAPRGTRPAATARRGCERPEGCTIRALEEPRGPYRAPAGQARHDQRTNERLHRAYLLKEQLRQAFHLRGKRGMKILDQWLSWARHCRIPAFVKLAAAITGHRPTINAALTNELSNARVESVNTKLRLLTRIAFGFRAVDALIGHAMLSLGGRCPPLPGRT